MTASLWRCARRGGITVAGLSMLAGGAVMLVLPGPGVAVILLGLAVLASEYAWAARLLARLRQHAARLGGPLRERWLRTRRPKGYQQASC
jgi:Putative transmembrane protein (PGPGW)